MKRLSNSGGLHFILCCIMIIPAGSLSHKKTKISGKMTFNPSKEEVQFFIEPLADKKYIIIHTIICTYNYMYIHIFIHVYYIYTCSSTE